MKKPRHSQILGLAELAVGVQFSVSFHSLFFLLRSGSSRQMLKCLWQMDAPTCYTKHLWMQVMLRIAGEFSLGLRNHYLSVRGNMTLRITTKETSHPTHSSELMPLLCLFPFYGASTQLGSFSKYSRINIQTVLRIFCVFKNTTNRESGPARSRSGLSL